MSAELGVAVTIQKVLDPADFFDRFSKTIASIAPPRIGESRRVGGAFPGGDLRTHGFGLGEGDGALFPGEFHIHPLFTDITLESILPALRARFTDGPEGEIHAACYCAFPLPLGQKEPVRAFRGRRDPASDRYRHVCYCSIQVVDGWGDVSVRLDPWLAMPSAEVAGVSFQGFSASLGQLLDAFLSFMRGFPDAHRSVETKAAGSQLRPDVYEALQTFTLAAGKIAAGSSGPARS